MIGFTLLEWIFTPRKMARKLGEDSVDFVMDVKSTAIKGAVTIKQQWNTPLTEQHTRYHMARLYIYVGAIVGLGLLGWIAVHTSGWIFWLGLMIVMGFFHWGGDKPLASNLAQRLYARSHGNTWDLDPVRDREVFEQEAERRILEMLPVLRKWEEMNPRQRRRRSPELLVAFRALIGGQAPSVKMPDDPGDDAPDDASGTAIAGNATSEGETDHVH